MVNGDPILKINQGWVKGKIQKSCLNDHYYSFTGIPYAKAPIGDLRFADPEPVEQWDEVYDATCYGPECPSSHILFGFFVGKEDNCLNLNVYSKELSNSQKSVQKPVMVFIHGGSFTYGSNKNDMYGADFFMTEEIVLVTINYRLGIFGFLSLEDDSLKVPGNAGLKDMLVALKWVQENISVFGGDRNNVTIFGNSAGAAAVHCLVLSSLAKGLFHKAIIQSGSAINPWVSGCKGISKLIESLKIDQNEKKALEKLRSTSPKKLVPGFQKDIQVTELCSEIRPLGPVVETAHDEAFLSHHPLEIMEKGTYTKVPIMIGFNSNEGLLYEGVKFVKALRNIDVKNDIPHDLCLGLSDIKINEIAEKIKSFYQLNIKDKRILEENIWMLKSDCNFVHGIHRTINYFVKSNPQPTYQYFFDYEGDNNSAKKTLSSKWMILNGMFLILMYIFDSTRFTSLLNYATSFLGLKKVPGACHGDDLPYLFKNFNSLYTKDVEVRTNMIKMWTNFARTGNPTPNTEDKGLNMEWKPLKKNNQRCLKIGKTLEIIDVPYHDRMAFWDSLYSEYKK